MPRLSIVFKISACQSMNYRPILDRYSGDATENTIRENLHIMSDRNEIELMKARPENIKYMLNNQNGIPGCAYTCLTHKCLDLWRGNGKMRCSRFPWTITRADA